MMEVVVTTGALGYANLRSTRHYQRNNTQLCTGRMPFLSPNQQCQNTEGKLPVTNYENETVFRRHICQDKLRIVSQVHSVIRE